MPPPQQRQLAALIAGIQKALNPEAILCFGCHFTSHHRWSCFTSREAYSDIQTITFDLLIITPTEDARPYHNTIQMAEQEALTVGCRVNVLVHQIHTVQECVQQEHYFFGKVCRQGAWLYKKQDIVLPVAPQAPQEEIANADTMWHKEIRRAKQFYSQAKTALSSDWYELTAFLLHQEVQHTCMALFKTIIGYYTNTHHLGRLLDLTGHFTDKLTAIFPANTAEEAALWALLQEAYSDARYNDKYSVSKTQAIVLAARVKQMLKVAEALHHKTQASRQKDTIMELLVQNMAE